ncbi:uncharacterized protein LOC143913762 [Arctopsyche grandis]|uniref:uncharacterized protein LOC143913762 n=1 Tax=Arctopsyche grandis TaxID=121162 RepID=UPI00406D7FFD
MECRLCLTITSIPTSISIFEDSGSLVKRIWNCCHIEIEKHDNLPDIICLMCKCKIELFNTFKNACIQSDKMLQLRLSESFRIKPEEVFLDDLDWEKESPINLCDSSTDTNDEAIESDVLDRNDNVTFSRDWTESAYDSIVDVKNDANQISNVMNSNTLDTLDDANKPYGIYRNERITLTRDFTENIYNFTVDAMKCADDANKSNRLYRYEETTSNYTGNSTHNYEALITKSPYKIHHDKSEYLHTMNGNDNPPEPLPKLKLPRKPREYKCKRCPERFKSIKLMVDHMNCTHIGHEPFKCEYCLKLVSSKHSLMSHVRTHTRQGLFKCPTCLKEFASKASLAKHIQNQRVQMQNLLNVFYK